MIHVVDPDLREVAGHDPAGLFGEAARLVVFDGLFKRRLAAVSGLRGVKFYAARLVFNEDASLGDPRIKVLRRPLHRNARLEVYPREDIVHTQDVRQQRQPELAVAARLGILRAKPEFLELPCRLSLIVWFHTVPLITPQCQYRPPTAHA